MSHSVEKHPSAIVAQGEVSPRGTKLCREDVSQGSLHARPIRKYGAGREMYEANAVASESRGKSDDL